jgi:hypothetical protein
MDEIDLNFALADLQRARDDVRRMNELFNRDEIPSLTDVEHLSTFVRRLANLTIDGQSIRHQSQLERLVAAQVERTAQVGLRTELWRLLTAVQKMSSSEPEQPAWIERAIADASELRTRLLRGDPLEPIEAEAETFLALADAVAAHKTGDRAGISNAAKRVELRYGGVARDMLLFGSTDIPAAVEFEPSPDEQRALSGGFSSATSPEAGTNELTAGVESSPETTVLSSGEVNTYPAEELSAIAAQLSRAVELLEYFRRQRVKLELAETAAVEGLTSAGSDARRIL